MDIPVGLSAAIAGYWSQLPDPAKTALTKAAGAVGMAGAKRAYRWAKNALRGSDEERAIQQALAGAIRATLNQHPRLQALPVAEVLGRPEIAEAIAQIIDDPLKPLDVGFIDKQLKDADIDLNALGFDAYRLLEHVRQTFLALLQQDPNTRQLFQSILAIQQFEELRSLRSDFSDLKEIVGAKLNAVLDDRLLAQPITQTGPQALDFARAISNQARGKLKAGADDEAASLLSTLLSQLEDVVDRVPSPEWLSERQAALLLLAQIAMRQGERKKARKLWEQASAVPVPITGRRRLFAGWLLVNFGEMERGREILRPEYDASDAWRNVLGIAELGSGDYDAFTTLFPDPSKVEDADVIGALVRYLAKSGKYGSALQNLVRLVAKAAESSAIFSRAVDSGIRLLGHYAAAPNPEPFDSAALVDILRNLFGELPSRETGLREVDRRVVLFDRVQFHQVLLERELARHAYRELSAIDLESSARLLALAPGAAGGEDLPVLASAAEHSVDRVILEAAAAERTDRPSAIKLLQGDGISHNDDDSDRLRAMEAELRMADGEPPEEVQSVIERIKDPVVKSCLYTEQVARYGGGANALDAVDSTLAKYANDLRALRMCFGVAEDLAESLTHAGGEPLERLKTILTTLGGRLVSRLYCPEHRLLRARANLIAEEFTRSYDEVVDVERAGYRTRRSGALLAQLTQQLNKTDEHADVTARLVTEYDLPTELIYDAAIANYRAKKVEQAAPLFRQGIAKAQSDDDVARGYFALAQIADETAPAGTTPGEAGLNVLLDAYTHTRLPHIASGLVMRTVGTPLERKVQPLIARDFQSLDQLPGIEAVDIEDAIRMNRAREQQGESALQLWDRGVAPFELVARGAPSLHFTWYALQGRFALTEPPLLSRRAITPDVELLLDHTALLTLGELDLLSRVLISPLPLSITRDVLLWARTEGGQTVLPGDQSRHATSKMIRSSIRGWHIVGRPPSTKAEKLRSQFETSTNWLAAYHLALGIDCSALLLSDHIDRELIPEKYRKYVVTSAAVLKALVEEDLVTLEAAGHAAAEEPDQFTAKTPQPRLTQAMRKRRLIVDYLCLGAWHRGGLLNSLSVWPGGVAVSGWTEARVATDAQTADVTERAMEAARNLSSALDSSVSGGRIKVVSGSSLMASRLEGEVEDPGNPESASDMLRSLTASVVARYEAAKGRVLWSDDAAVHLYLSDRGPYANEIPFVRERAEELRSQYQGVSVVATSSVLAELQRLGLVTEEERQILVAQLASAGRWFPIDRDNVAWAATIDSRVANAHHSYAEQILASLVRHLDHLTPEMRGRQAAEVSRALTAAIAILARTGEEGPIRVVVDAFVPWTLPSANSARLAARLFWMNLAVNLMEDEIGDTRAAISTASDVVRNSAPVESFLHEEWWDAIEALMTFPPVTSALVKRRAEAFSALADWGSRAVDSVADAKTPNFPNRASRLAGIIVGVALSTKGAVTVQLHHDGHPVSVEYEAYADDAETEALRQLKDEPCLQSKVRINARTNQSWAPQRQVDVSVDHLLLLPTATRPQRMTLVKQLRAGYELSGAGELAHLIELEQDAICDADESKGYRAIKRLYRLFLASPRFWIDQDPRRAIDLVAGATLDHLRRAVGSPSPWRAGETLSQRLVRLMTEGSENEPSMTEARRLLTQALFGTTSHVDATVLYAEELRGKPTDEPSLTTIATRHLFGLLGDARPHQRRRAFAVGLHLLQVEPTVSSAPFDPGVIGEVGQHFAPLGGEPLHAVAARLLSAQIAVSASAASGSVSVTRGDKPPHPDSLLREMLSNAHEFDALHAVFARLVSNNVLSETHAFEASNWLSTMGVTPDIADPVGDLLLLSQLTSEELFENLVGLDRDFVAESARSLRLRLEKLATQLPYASIREPVNEVWMASLYGVGPTYADVYTGSLLAILQRLLENSTRIPQWWTSQVAGTMRKLAQAPLGPGAERLSTLSSTVGISDRFESLMTVTPQARARDLLSKVGSAKRRSRK